MSHSWGRGKGYLLVSSEFHFLYSRCVLGSGYFLMTTFLVANVEGQSFVSYRDPHLIFYILPSISRSYPIFFTGYSWSLFAYFILFRTLYALSLTMRTVFNFFCWICWSHRSLVVRIKLDWILKKDANMLLFAMDSLPGRGGILW